MRGARDMRDLSHPLVDETPLTAIRVWLFAVAGLVIAMIVIGGATRLTDSGLSITEWLPLLGAIPPLSQQDWLLAFEKYRQIPEYELVNKGMSLAEFKFIYWWEWAHRFFGRLIGIAYAVPLFVFWLLGRVPTGLLPKLLAILALGGLQGFFGWYMVQSGLVERVDVSHYRLALHLVTAFVILASLLWVAFDLAGDQADDRSTLDRRDNRCGPVSSSHSRRICRRPQSRPYAQHLAPDGRCVDPRRAAHSITLASEPDRQRDNSSVHPPVARLRFDRSRRLAHCFP